MAAIVESRVQIITADELAALIKSKEASYLIIDVRDVDFHGGNITGAINIPSEEFPSRVQKLVEDVQGKDIHKIIFHCYLSQIRGLQAARIYEQTLLDQSAPDDHPSQDILLLEGGFTLFQTKYKDDLELVENFDPSVWNEEKWDKDVWTID